MSVPSSQSSSRLPLAAPSIPSGAWVPGPRVQIAGATGKDLPLANLRFAVKEVLDVVGTHTTLGNPEWRTNGGQVASTNSYTVQRLLDAGASVDGKTICDEFVIGLDGRNWHFGTPVNARWPLHYPGGSSSGSVAAVSAGEVDFALGTDIFGSVRVPSAFCGLWGLRPTYSTEMLQGCAPGVGSKPFGTVGFHTRDAQMLQKVGLVALPPETSAPATKVKSLVRSSIHFNIRHRTEATDGMLLEKIAKSLGAQDEFRLFNGKSVEAFMEPLSQLRCAATRTDMSDWFKQSMPERGPLTAQRQDGSFPAVSDEFLKECSQQVQSFVHELDAYLADHWLLMPTVPYALVPREDSKRGSDALRNFYNEAGIFTHLAAAGGYPELTIPFECLPSADGSVQAHPLALSIVGARGDDRALMQFVQSITEKQLKVQV